MRSGPSGAGGGPERGRRVLRGLTALQVIRPYRPGGRPRTPAPYYLHHSAAIPVPPRMAYHVRSAAVPHYSAFVRLVIARCSVDYDGRLTAHLPSALRLLIVKADGSVLVHSDGGSYKPLNWMSPPCRLTEHPADGDQPGRWTVTNKAGETLT